MGAAPNKMFAINRVTVWGEYPITSSTLCPTSPTDRSSRDTITPNRSPTSTPVNRPPRSAPVRFFFAYARYSIGMALSPVR